MKMIFSQFILWFGLVALQQANSLWEISCSEGQKVKVVCVLWFILGKSWILRTATQFPVFDVTLWERSCSDRVFQLVL